MPYGPDDGTIAGSAALCSIVFAPEIVWPVVRRWLAQGELLGDRKLRAGGFNATLADDASPCWIAPGEFGLDQGMIVLMIENFRSGLLWQLGRGNRSIAAGLRRAGFRGGWL